MWAAQIVSGVGSRGLWTVEAKGGGGRHAMLSCGTPAALPLPPPSFPTQQRGGLCGTLLARCLCQAIPSAGEQGPADQALPPPHTADRMWVVCVVGLCEIWWCDGQATAANRLVFFVGVWVAASHYWGWPALQNRSSADVPAPLPHLRLAPACRRRHGAALPPAHGSAQRSSAYRAPAALW